MERLQLQEAFENVKPLCVELINSPSVASAIKLRTTLETISDGVVQDLTKYLLLPITLHIKNNEIRLESPWSFLTHAFVYVFFFLNDK